jgi:futalosine hydrolase
MKILIVAATIQEVLPFIKSMNLKEKTKDTLYIGEYKTYQLEILVTGIGMVTTAYYLTKMLIQNKYDLALNVGIAGSYKKEIAVGDVVNVVEDRFSELGAEDGDNFISMQEIQLQSKGSTPELYAPMINPYTNDLKSSDIYRKVKGITVNTIHGNEKGISKIVEKFNPDIETMEGAAFMYVCLSEGVKFIQLRAISNYIERRNKEKWNIPLSVQNLNNNLHQMFEKEIV